MIADMLIRFRNLHGLNWPAHSDMMTDCLENSPSKAVKQAENDDQTLWDFLQYSRHVRH